MPVQHVTYLCYTWGHMSGNSLPLVMCFLRDDIMSYDSRGVIQYSLHVIRPHHHWLKFMKWKWFDQTDILYSLDCDGKK